MKKKRKRFIFYFLFPFLVLPVYGFSLTGRYGIVNDFVFDDVLNSKDF